MLKTGVGKEIRARYRMMVYISTALFEIGVPVMNTEAPFISRMTRILVLQIEGLARSC